MSLIISPYRFSLAPVPVSDDPYWGNVVSLLHFDGTDSSTTFTDQTSKTWTASGNAQIDTAQSMFGGASGLFDGAGDYISTASSTDFDFGAGDWTVECFIRLGALTDSVFVARRSASGFTPFGLSMFSSKLQMLVSKTGTSWAATKADPAPMSTGTWYHIALVRDGGTLRLFRDGTQVASQAITGSVMSSTAPVIVGAWGTGTYFTNGHIEELRITKGVARYTANFTPPTAPF